MTLAPIDLLASVVHLRPGGTIHAGPRAPVPEPDGGGWRLRACHARTDADVHAGRWQVHPEAEEIVSCLIGKIRLHLRPERPGRQEEVIRLGAGTAAIVPRGRWHRIGLDTPSTVLAVTLPDGTRLEDPARARDRTATPKAGRR
ncbi:cupin domain-containing protein [Actinomadura sp. WMMB 499]|uniref:cupin domain-containing protein n=1 Tax=Actinomadura sp. WMMB 499 TaxID=1219491 RepID=UPI001246E628|nr:cupin domain-containing protein [Actinomadura sp. WMMB 499]QFG26711.1 cupin domain-containing protein [Actinomadura sp. WMMB 499]